MKCPHKYQWVKLPRDIPDMGKGPMAYWATLASRAALHKGNASYCGHSNPVALGNVGGWCCRILGVRSRAKALQILDVLSSLFPPVKL